MLLYKDIFVASGSALADALAKRNDVEAKRIYDDMTRRYEAQYSEADRAYFWEHQKIAIAIHKRGRNANA